MKYCMGCMREIEEYLDVCPHCGFIEKEYISKEYALPIHSKLREGRFEIGKVIGRGGFGIAYIAFDTVLSIPVAIKEFYPHGTQTRDVSLEATEALSATVVADDELESYEEGKRRVLFEARNAAKVHTPGIVYVRDFFEENNTVYIVMDYVRGETLTNYINNHKLSSSEKIKLIEPVFDALSQVHKEGLIHRDISPDNIMINENGTAVLLDFGAARSYANQHQNMTQIFKAGYTPIEQLSTKAKQGPWTDIYALGATLYRIITGECPETSNDRLVNDEIKNIAECVNDLSESEAFSIMKAIAVQCENRWQTIEDFREGLISQKIPNNFCNTGKNKHDISKQYFDRAEEIVFKKNSSDDFNKWMRLGQDSLKAKNYSEAYSYFIKAVEICPNNWRAVYDKGRTAAWLSTAEEIRLNEMDTAFYTSIGNIENLDEKGEFIGEFIQENIDVNFHISEILHNYEQVTIKNSDFCIMSSFFWNKLFYFKDNVSRFESLLTLLDGIEEIRNSNHLRLMCKKIICSSIKSMCDHWTWYNDFNYGGSAGFSGEEKAPYIDNYWKLVYEIRNDEPQYRCDEMYPIDPFDPPESSEDNLNRNNIVIEYWKTELPKKRIKMYWDEHTEEKSLLDNRIAEIQKKKEEIQRVIDSLNLQIAAVQDELESRNRILRNKIVKVEDKITELDNQRNTLGVLAVKQKKELKVQMDQLNQKLTVLRETVDREIITNANSAKSEIDSIEIKINPLLHSISELSEEEDSIVQELTKER